MKRTILTLIALLIFSTTLSAQGFVEEFRSEPGRRPPVNSAFGVGWAEMAIHDLNGNSAPDILFKVEISGGEALVVYDGQSREQIWELPESSISLNFETIEFAGFFKFYQKQNNEYEATHLVILGIVLGESDMRGAVIDIETQTIDWQMQNIEPMTVTDMDDDNRPEILVLDLDSRQIVMVGWEDGGSGSASQKMTTPRMELPVATGENYALNLKFESEPDFRLAYSGRLAADLDNLDSNGDDVPEIIMLIEDSNDEPAGLAVRDGATTELIWRFDFPDSGPIRDDILRGFHGFFDVNGDGQREAIFGNRTAVTLDKTPHRIDENFEILAVHDLDDDGYADLIGRGVQDSTVQVWGAGNPTGVSKQDLAIAGFRLQQNYPNPFNAGTTLEFTVPRAQQVSIKVYDIAGREVEILLDEKRAAGSHTLKWAPQDLSSGAYFVQIRTESFVETKKAILLK